MRLRCRPGAPPLERLEAHIASGLCSRPGFAERAADLLARATAIGPMGEAALRQIFAMRPGLDPAEALGIARAMLVLCGAAPEHGVRLSGEPRRDLARLMEGEFPLRDLCTPSTYALPSLLEAYCHMGAGYARGVDGILRAVTGRSLLEHLSRALARVEPTARSA